MKDRIEQHDAFTSAVLSKCRRAAYLFDVDPAAVEEEALRLIRNPQLAPEFTVEQIELERGVLYDVARKRGIPLEEVKPEIDALVDTLVASIRAQRA